MSEADTHLDQNEQLTVVSNPRSIFHVFTGPNNDERQDFIGILYEFHEELREDPKCPSSTIREWLTGFGLRLEG